MPREGPTLSIYLGTFLVAMATLALEITLTRLLSVSTWYHLAFFCLATAMLGMTAAAVTVFLVPRWFEPQRRAASVARACLGFAVVTPLALFLLCVLPLALWPDPMSALLFLFATAVCALPFYFSGIAISAVLTRFELPPGRIYGADLLGAATGCLLVLAGLDSFDAPTLVLICGAIGVPAALAYTWDARDHDTRGAVALGLLSLVAIGTNLSIEPRIRPIFVKQQLDLAGDAVVDEWNSFSRVVVEPQIVAEPAWWGRSPRAPADQLIPRYPMHIDGLAGTSLGRFESPADIDYLRFDVTNVAYALRRGSSAAVIGVGGGRDIQSALLFGFTSVRGIDVNPIFIDLLEGRFSDFAGLGGRDDVVLVVDDARSHLARTADRFDLIQMSLIDTWAATGAGAFTLSENALYTVEAWQIFLDRLTDDGLFTVSRWYDPRNLGETGRLVSLATATLLERGIADPARHLAMATVNNVSTLIVSARPFTPADVAQLESIARRLDFSLPLVPGKPIANRVLREIATADSIDELEERVADEVLNYQPPRDETPYFFNMLRFGQLNLAEISSEGTTAGNLLATAVLSVLILSLAVMAVLTIALPLWLRRGAQTASRVRPAGAIFFSAIGAGFMLLEIGLLQRLSVFLGHPVYALGILLFTLIASTGLGSLASERLPLTRVPGRRIFPLLTVMLIACLGAALGAPTAAFEGSAQAVKIGVAMSAVAPAGLLLGLFFPTGMQLCGEGGSDPTPWYWALNGIFSVLASALAVFFSIYSGIATNFYIAAVCYTVAGVALQRLAPGR